MKLINKTAYPTRELRKVIVEVHRRLAKTEGRLKTWSWIPITVTYTRGGGYSGYSYYSGSSMTLRVPSPEQERKRVEFWKTRGEPDGVYEGISRKQLAALAEHEFFHAYGYKHGSFPRSIAADWATGRILPVEPKSKVVSRDERRAKKLEVAMKAVARWQSKAKLAKTKLVKWQRRVRALNAVISAERVAAKEKEA